MGDVLPAFIPAVRYNYTHSKTLMTFIVVSQLNNMVSPQVNSPLVDVEPHFRILLPATLYTEVWLDPTPDNLMRVFDHLRSLQHILQDYLPRQIVEHPPLLGELSYEWQEGTLMFTDLAGFTSMMEALAGRGREGALEILEVLNRYFAHMLEIISKSGGNLLEFTGDALLVLFPADRNRDDAGRAIRAGLRMQRAMADFAQVETPAGTFTLRQRIGIHQGRFVMANIGTPRRMELVLLGKDVYNTKIAEGAGLVGRVSLTDYTYQKVQNQFRAEPGQPDHWLIVDDFEENEVGDYELIPSRRRLSKALILDKTVPGILTEIQKLIHIVEPLASYLPFPALRMVVESTQRGKIAPSINQLYVLFVSLAGLPEAVGTTATSEEEATLIEGFSRTFAHINAIVDMRGGLLKKVTYQAFGSNILIYFGAPNAHTNDPLRAARTALEIRDIVASQPPFMVGGQPLQVECQIGLASGSSFVAEVGEPRGRREFNILGDTVNTAARLMVKSGPGRVYITQPIQEQIQHTFTCTPLGSLELKGKTPLPIFQLEP